MLNTSETSPRYSKDLDIFHDLESAVAARAESDGAVLTGHGYLVNWLLRQPAFQRAEIAKGEGRLLIEWAFDSAFRFFPVERDELTGWRLNPFDAGTNKLLALAGRGEPRDYVDVLHFIEQHLSLGALCWAAAGKDPGLNPFMILRECQRTTRFRPEQFQELQLAFPLDLQDLKAAWIAACRSAESLLQALPPEDVGCIYIDSNGKPVDPNPETPAFKSLRKHFGSMRGAWPAIL